MTEDRRKEIALKLVEQRLAERGIPGADELKRDIGNAAKKIGVKTEELMEFYQSCVPQLLDKIFGFKRNIM
jgi:hypothetical protein